MYPKDSRLRYRDQLDGPTGLVVGFHYSSASEEWQYEIKWSDYPHVMAQTAYFIDHNMEVW